MSDKGMVIFLDAKQCTLEEYQEYELGANGMVMILSGGKHVRSGFNGKNVFFSKDDARVELKRILEHKKDSREKELELISNKIKSL